MSVEKILTNTLCDLCKTPIYRRPGLLKKNKGKFCSHACRNKGYKRTGPTGPNPKLQGSNNPAWIGGVITRPRVGNYKGALYARCPKAFLTMARKDGYVLQHRLVMAKVIGRCLKKSEIVHHIDHDPHNNKPENLMLFFSNSAHKLYESSMKGEGLI